MDRKHTLIPIQLEEGYQILIMPVDNNEEGSTETEFTKASLVKDTFDNVIGSIKSISKKIKIVIEESSPDEATVEFAIGFSAKASKITAVLVDGDGNASIKVQLKWKKHNS